MNTYLLIFTIGPVQSFIASARKTQDLFAGSAILSNLVKCACERLENKIEAPASIEPVFPKLDSQSLYATNPNRFAVLVKKFEGDIEKIIQQVKAEVINDDFVKIALGKLSKDIPEKQALHPNATYQLQNLPEIYWGAMKLENIEEEYAEKYTLLESYLGGIKNIRNLVQFEEAGRKCNVDGVHNVIIYRMSENNESTHKLYIDTATNPVHIIKKQDEAYAKIWELSPGEGLSAVSFYKRRVSPETGDDNNKAYQIAHNYPSTARVSLMHLLEPSGKEGRQNVKEFDEFKDYNKLVGSNGTIFEHSDDQLFYEENINVNTISKGGVLKEGYTNETALEKIKEGRKALSEKMKAEKLEDFTTKYYALLMFDGDRMGEWLSGENLADKIQLLAFHQELSELLHEFAKQARGILVEPHGKTVYAAGEDFLGFVNLNSLIKVLKELRNLFDTEVNQKIKKAFKFKPLTPGSLETPDLTFSAGIAIAHYKQPLPTVLEEARSAEKTAKDTGGNRCCISVMRHSGGTTRCVLPFGEEREKVEEKLVLKLEQIGALQIIIREIKEDNFSNTFIYQLIREMRIWEKVEIGGMFDTEAKRLIERASNHSKTNKKAAVIKFNKQFELLTETNSTKPLNKSELDNTFATLRIADFIQRNLKGEAI
jgi:CRISPR-associated protein Cmr2